MGNQFGPMLDPFVDSRNGAAGLAGPAIAFALSAKSSPTTSRWPIRRCQNAAGERRACCWSAWGAPMAAQSTSGDPAVVGATISARTRFAGGLDCRVMTTVVGVALAGGSAIGAWRRGSAAAKR
jgi:hypothetical protein